MIEEQLKQQQIQLAMQMVILQRQLKVIEEQYDATTNALYGATTATKEAEQREDEEFEAAMVEPKPNEF